MLRVLTEEQRERLMDLHAYEWVADTDEESAKALQDWFRNVTSELELWYATWIVQWDVARGDLLHMINHPLCTSGTALFMYWVLGPGEIRLAQQNGIALDEWQTGALATLDLLEQRLLENCFPRGVLGFSPDDFIRHRRAKRSDAVPPPLREPVDGIFAPYDTLDEVFRSTR